MILKSSLSILALVGLSLSAHAQAKEAPVQIRAVLHDPVHPTAELFYPNEAGTVVKLDFRPQDLSRELSILPVNGSLVLYDKAAIDPEEPGRQSGGKRQAAAGNQAGDGRGDAGSRGRETRLPDVAHRRLRESLPRW